MYPYHNRIKQRIRAGELTGYYFTDRYPGIGKALVLEFRTPPFFRPVRPQRFAEYQKILEEWERSPEQRNGS